MRTEEAVQGLHCAQSGNVLVVTKPVLKQHSSSTLLWVKGCPAASRVGGGVDGWTWDFCLEAEVCSQLSYRSSHPFSGQGAKLGMEKLCKACSVSKVGKCVSTKLVLKQLQTALFLCG